MALEKLVEVWSDVHHGKLFNALNVRLSAGAVVIVRPA